ncbi:PREDICTED: poly(U)-specific endoribonuclease homolog isoform X2 [Eufriesea mexicana]|uniref:poly(U)-specific endoribonuclease homolog isoform X2 n=1 Tax=Eufriesea mexicana TaxID=516756 RepID=UPI00083C0834|nr:PREDICTED: poly(U)-specific endoribonuclease homolog isoform X2 [Eufriesea mexicana]
MNIKLILICTILVLFTFVDIGDGKLSRGGGWGTLLRSRSSPRSRSSQSSSNRRQQHNQGGSTPDKIGWNVPDKKPSGTNTAPKPSAPVLEHSAKTSATNVQSGYNPSAGHGYNPSVGQGHNPSIGQGYNSPVGQGYNPSIGQSYNPSIGHGYNPSVGHGYNPSVGQGYHPPVGQSYNPAAGQGYYPSQGHGYSPLGHAPSPGFGQPSYSPSFGQAPSPGTIFVQQAQKPGLGQLAKEAFVFAGVSAGVNAAVSRLLPGGIYGTRGSGGGGGGSHTEITYNNYYNNGTAPAPAPAPASSSDQSAAVPAVQPLAGSVTQPPAAPAAAQPAAETPQTSQNNAGTNSASSNNANSQTSGQNNANPHGFIISDADIKKLTESLFEKEKNSALQYITINLQGQKKDESTNDDATEPLLTVKDEAYEIPTVKAMLPLYDNYELDVKTPEIVTADERKEEMELLDKIFETDVIKTTMKFLADRSGFIPDDEYEFRDTMKRLWFSQFKRIDGGASSSGFETVFLAEQFDSDIIGLHNWIYYAKQEAEKKLNYLGYIKEVKLGDKGAILKVRSSLNGIVQPVTTLFVGTSPELEFALYTMCFFVRPNNLCPVSLGGTEFSIFVSGINYFGKDILISGYPDI